MQSANLSGPFRGCLYYALLGLPQATGLAGGYDLIQGPANDLQHGTWVIILAQQGREDQGKQDIRKFLCGKLLRERIRTNLCIPLQDRTQAR